MDTQAGVESITASVETITYESQALRTQRDSLTGLPDKWAFHAQAGPTARRIRGEGHEPALVSLDLAHFGLVNERDGFGAGDWLLTRMANALREAFADALVTHIAEDHFAVVCRLDDVEAGVKAVRDIVDVYKQQTAVSLKAGVVALPDADVFPVDAYYAHAQAACDSIKGDHGSYLKRYDDEFALRRRRRQYVLDNYQEALQDQRFAVWYQPVYAAADATLVGSEALVRWQDPVHGTIPPSEFVPLLEEVRLVDRLDAYVLQRVCTDWKGARAAGVELPPVSVNFSRMDFQVVDVAGMVADEAGEAGMPREHLHVEVTESADVVTDERLASQIARLHAGGFEVWMDDFGTGTSSLAQLDLHDFDVVKLDMAFLRQFDRPQTKLILTSVVDMLKKLGVRVLMEGVETEEQYHFLRSIGCDYIQGYYFARPMPYEDFYQLASGRG